MSKKSTAKSSSKKGTKKPLKKAVAKKSSAKAKPVKKNAAKTKIKSVKKAAPARKAKKVPVKAKKTVVKTAAKKAQPKVIAKKEESKKTVAKTSPKDKQAASVKTAAKAVKPEIKKKEQPSPAKAIKTENKKKEQAATVKSKVMEQTAAKTKADADEKFHNKAQRIIKELEETMDIDKVKPRIKVPVFSSSKPKQVVPQKLPEPVNTGKDKYQLEFEFRSSKGILFSYLSDSSGMAGWFADEVRSSDNNFVFVWEGTEMHAKQIAVKDLQLVRYQWMDENDGTYFQFEIREDDITSDIALLITDWAFPAEKETNRMLWENQVQKLRQLIGSL
jgi:hypothetical protein